MLKLNSNRTQRIVGFFFLGVYLSILIVYLFYDGWHFEWIHYGYSGANQHFDLDIFGDMQWDIIGGERVYYSTNNLHNLVYICYYIGLAGALALIFDNKWLRQSLMGTFAFPIMSFFSTINPFVAKDIFTLDIFYYHSYFLQIFYDLNHLSGTIMGIYLFYIAAKRNEEIEFKYISPMIFFTWFLFILARIFLQKWPFWAPENSLGMISTNQINNMPFFLYGLEYGVVVLILYGVNAAIKFVNRKIPNPKLKTLFPFAVFVILTIVFIMTGLVVLQEIPWQAFIQ